jgi:hypothetical protein
MYRRSSRTECSPSTLKRAPKSTSFICSTESIVDFGEGFDVDGEHAVCELQSSFMKQITTELHVDYESESTSQISGGIENTDFRFFPFSERFSGTGSILRNCLRKVIRVQGYMG